MVPRAEFAKIFTYLAAAFPRYKYDEMTIAVYHDILGDLDLQLLQSAVRHFASESGPWFPSAGELRKVAFDLMERENPDAVPDAGAAWDEALRLHNIWTPPSAEKFSHPAVFEAYKGVGGSRGIGMTDEDKLFTTRSQFMRLYEVYSKRERTTERMLPEVRSRVQELVASVAKRLTAKGD